jgi:hypothetical protein
MLRSRVPEPLPGLLVFLGAAAIYGTYGFDGPLSRDGANHFYAGQRMADGVPPYVSIFNHKTPLASMLAGLGVMLAGLLGRDEVSSVRFLFYLIGCATAVSVYFLGRYVFHSRRAGLLGAALFLAFAEFGGLSASGPHPKPPLVLFETLSLLAMCQRRWLLAGLSGSLAFLTWQPMAIFPLVTLVLAAACPPETRPRAVVRTLAGLAVPLAVTAAYFLSRDALYDVLDGSILFNLRYLDRGQPSALSNLRSIGWSVWRAYGTALLPIVIGFAVMLSMYAGAIRRRRAWREALVNDPFAPLLLTFPAPVAWSLLDFQASSDFFVFLPYLAIASGYTLHRAADTLEGLTARWTAAPVPTLLVAGVCAALMAWPWLQPRREAGLDLEGQKAVAAEIRQRFGGDARFVSIGAPQLLVLLRAVNPNRYPFIINGIDRHIDANTRGGFEGWLSELEAWGPDVIAVGTTRGRHVPTLMRWIESRYDGQERGPWKLYVRR